MEVFEIHMFACSRVSTVEEYERQLWFGESLPQEFVRMEEDGTWILVILPSGEPVIGGEPPRIKDPEVLLTVD